jgi:hypothetical protein
MNQLVFLRAIEEGAALFDDDTMRHEILSEEPDAQRNPHNQHTKADDDMDNFIGDVLRNVQCVTSRHLPRNDGHRKAARIGLAELVRMVGQRRETRIHSGADVLAEFDPLVGLLSHGLRRRKLLLLNLHNHFLRGRSGGRSRLRSGLLAEKRRESRESEDEQREFLHGAEKRSRSFEEVKRKVRSRTKRAKTVGTQSILRTYANEV